MVPDAILRSIDAATGTHGCHVEASVAGGSINHCLRIRAAGGIAFFLKIGDASCLDQFAAERAGLQELRLAGALRVPEPIACQQLESHAWLLLEHLELGPRSAAAAAACGTRLALQHRRISETFGWHRDNTIGATPQPNVPAVGWLGFFRDRRLGHQLGLARQNGYAGRLQQLGDELLGRLGEWLADRQPEASLLHGDLWGGNWGVTGADEPVVFDPAVYYGDREADIAMTMLFGGFPDEFYAAYREAWPLDPGFEQRCDLYNLYHVLNHLNLFGGGYLEQAVHIMSKLLGRTR